jgi:hypothetical protein
VSDVFDPLVPEQPLKRPARTASGLASILIVLGAFVGIGVFLDSQHNVAVTGSVICNKGQACTTTPVHKPGAGGSATGSVSATGSGSAAGSADAAGGSGQSGLGSSGAQNPSASGDSSGSAGKSGSLALTGAEIALLVFVALALLVAGIVVYHLSKKKTNVR